MKAIYAFTLAFAAIAAAPAHADLALAKAKGCTACHDINKKLLGPAYTEVAKKNKGDPKAVEKLAQSVVKGSQGKYGPVPMPPNKVTEEEAKKLAAWVLTL
jgi:cytochrome c